MRLELSLAQLEPLLLLFLNEAQAEV